MSLLRFEQVSKEYGSGETRVRALDGVTVSVAPGEVVALYGPSGSGKTTFLQLSAGLDEPTAGRVLLKGSDLAGLGEGELTELRRREFGFVFQFFNLVEGLNAVENAALPLRFDGVSYEQANERALEVLTAVGIEHRRHHLPSEMSGGEMQRVAVARALAPRPSLVLADEPTGNLDSRTGEALLELITDLSRVEGVAVVLSSHDPRAAGYADRVLNLHDGRFADGPGPAEREATRAEP